MTRQRPIYPRLPILIVVTLMFAVLLCSMASGVSDQLTRLTSVSASDRQCSGPDISADGRFVVFHSDSDFLGEGIEAKEWQVWLLEIETGKLTQVSGPLQADRTSTIASVSANGERVVFKSDADFLGEGLSKNQSEIWLYDVPSDSLSRLTYGTEERRQCYDPVLSDDGSTVAFRSDSDFHDEGIADNQWEIWLYSIAEDTFTRVTHTLQDSRGSARPSLTADGSRVVFDSDGDFLDEGVADGQYETWLYDATTDQLTRVTDSPAEDRNCLNARISGNGSLIGFRSDYDFYGEGIVDGQSEVWVYHVETGSLERITWASEAGRGSLVPSISADGSTVVFYSDSDFFGAGVSDNQFEIWLFRLAESAYQPLSASSGEGRTSSMCSVNSNGTVVVFASDSDFHDEGIADDQRELWLWRGAAD